MALNSLHAIAPEDRPINAIVLPRPGKTASLIVTCAAETKLIGDYLSDDLDTGSGQAFGTHLKACPQCAAFLSTYKKTVEITQGFLKLQALKPQPVKFMLRLPLAL